jgi:hypothetical protein
MAGMPSPEPDRLFIPSVTKLVSQTSLMGRVRIVLGRHNPLAFFLFASKIIGHSSVDFRLYATRHRRSSQIPFPQAS